MSLDFFKDLDVAIESYGKLGIPIAAIIVGRGNAVKIKELYKILFMDEGTDLMMRMDIMNQVNLNKLSYRDIPILISDKSIQFQFVFNTESDATRVATMKDVIDGVLPDNVLPFKK
jgi:hypothetical protein